MQESESKSKQSSKGSKGLKGSIDTNRGQAMEAVEANGDWRTIETAEGNGDRQGQWRPLIQIGGRGGQWRSLIQIKANGGRGGYGGRGGQ